MTTTHYSLHTSLFDLKFQESVCEWKDVKPYTKFKDNIMTKIKQSCSRFGESTNINCESYRKRISKC